MGDLENVKVGDTLLLSSRYEKRLVNVIKITKTQIIVTNGLRFRRDTVESRGTDVWTRKWIKVPTPKEIQYIKLKRLQRTLKLKLLELTNALPEMKEETVVELLEKLN